MSKGLLFLLYLATKIVILLDYCNPTEEKKEKNALFGKIQRTFGMSDTQKFGASSYVKIKERQPSQHLAAPARDFEHHTDARHLLEEEIFVVLTHETAGEALEGSMAHEHRDAGLVARLVAADILAHLYLGVAHGAELKHLLGRNLIILTRLAVFGDDRNLKLTLLHQMLHLKAAQRLADKKEVAHHRAQLALHTPLLILIHPILHGNEALEIVLLEIVAHTKLVVGKQADGIPGGLVFGIHGRWLRCLRGRRVLGGLYGGELVLHYDGEMGLLSNGLQN